MIPYRYRSLEAHLRLIADSHLKLTGMPIFAGLNVPPDPIAYLQDADFALVSHGTEQDPVFNYGNRLALQLFEMDWETFTRLPSRLSAEAPLRDERSRLLSEVKSRGYIQNYSGIRIASSGRRFRIKHATVWNLIDDRGNHCGQAARFSEWDPVPLNQPEK